MRFAHTYHPVCSPLFFSLPAPPEVSSPWKGWVEESLTITQKGIMPRVQPDGDRPLPYPCVGKWPTILLVCTVILRLAATTGARAKVDPKALRMRHCAASTRGNVAGTLALDTEDAVIDGTVGRCAAATCVEKAALQKELESRVAIQVRATGLKDSVSSNVDTPRFAVWHDNAEKAGVDRIIRWDIFSMTGDQIASIPGPLWERTDPQTARLVAWQRVQQSSR